MILAGFSESPAIRPKPPAIGPRSARPLAKRPRFRSDGPRFGQEVYQTPPGLRWMGNGSLFQTDDHFRLLNWVALLPVLTRCQEQTLLALHGLANRYRFCVPASHGLTLRRDVASHVSSPLESSIVDGLPGFVNIGKRKPETLSIAERLEQWNGFPETSSYTCNHFVIRKSFHRSSRSKPL